jgi:hypothetical protein
MYMKAIDRIRNTSLEGGTKHQVVITYDDGTTEQANSDNYSELFDWVATRKEHYGFSKAYLERFGEWRWWDR